MTAQITIVDARWLTRRSADCLPLFAEATVWYFGDDHPLYTELRLALPHDLRWGNVGQRLNEICETHQQALIDMEQAFRIDDLAWWECRSIAERSPNSTSFTADCCRFLLFCDLLSDGAAHVFIIEAPDLGDLLTRTARQWRMSPQRLGPGRLNRWADTYYRRARGAAGYARAAWRRWRRVRRLAGLRRDRPVPVDKLRNCDVLFAAWTRADDFPAVGQRDTAHSMGLLPKLFREQGLTVGFIALPLDEISDPEAIAEMVVRSDEAAILPDDTIDGGQLLATCLRALPTKVGPIAGRAIDGYPVDGVASMVLARDQFDWRATNAALWSHIGPYLATQGCQPKAVFHVYENQTWEKGLRHGLRHALSKCRIIGCQQSPLSNLYLNMLPATSERPPHRWPDAVLSHGPRGVRQLTGAGAPQASVVDAGLFRQGAFLRNRLSPSPGCETRRIVCATGPGYQECLELACKATAAVKGRTDMTLIINFHPITTDGFRDGVRRFVEDVGTMDDNVQFSDRPISDLFEVGIAAVLYADTNSGFEAVSSGARAINVLRDHALSFDKLPDGLARRVRSVEGIRRALDEIGDDEKWPSEEFLKAALADCFSEIDLDAILTAAGLDQAASTVIDPKTNKAVTL